MQAEGQTDSQTEVQIVRRMHNSDHYGGTCNLQDPVVQASRTTSATVRVHSAIAIPLAISILLPLSLSLSLPSSSSLGLSVPVDAPSISMRHISRFHLIDAIELPPLSRNLMIYDERRLPCNCNHLRGSISPGRRPSVCLFIWLVWLSGKAASTH